MGLWDTMRTIRAARQVHLPDAAVTAGDEGERAALEEVQRLARSRGAACRWYPALRVPRSGEKGKHEIDLLVASPFGLVGLEVKHWGGQVEAAGNGEWHQVSSQGESRRHDDPAALVAAKVAAVRDYLAAHGVAVPVAALASAVVLTNPGLALGTGIAGRADVVRLPKLAGLLVPRLGPPRGFWAALGRLVGFGAGASPHFPDFAALTRVLDRLPTWDVVHLYGGKIVKGDVARPGITLASGQTLTRRDAATVQVHVPRDWLFGWFVTPAVAWTDATGAHRREPLRLGQSVSIRPAGSRDEVALPVEHVERITFGWRDQSYYQPPKPDLASYRPGTVYRGTVTGVQDYGVFVNLDGCRDGLVHVSRLQRRQRAPAQYQVGQPVAVVVVRTEVRKGKEVIELDLHDGPAAG